MKSIYFYFLLLLPLLFTSCASGYDTINTQGISYISKSSNDGLTMDYKYEYLDKKYAKKLKKKGVIIVNAKITNNSDKDIIIGSDTKLSYSGGSEIEIIEPTQAFKEVKQSAASYLFYLLLAPVNFTTSTNGEQTSSFPVGLILGPGLAGANMIAVGSANKKFKTDIIDKNLLGQTIPPGESKTGLITIRSTSHGALNITLR